MTRELRIGIFFGTAILILAVFIFIVGDMSVLLRKPGFALVGRYSTRPRDWINGRQ